LVVASAPEAAATAKGVKTNLRQKSSVKFDSPSSSVNWSRLHGLILLEIFNHLEHIVEDAGSLYRAEVLALIEQAGVG